MQIRLLPQPLLPRVTDCSVKVKFSQLCPILCDSMDYTVHGILQARILEWVAIPFRGSFQPNPGIKPRSPTSLADSLPAEPPGNCLVQLGIEVKIHCVFFKVLPNNCVYQIVSEFY